MEQMLPGDRTFRDEVVRLASLTVVTDVIERVTFTNCDIIGPAVIALVGKSEMRNCAIEGDFEAAIWDTGDRNLIIGAVGFQDCTLVGCTLRRIGIAVPPALIDEFRRGFGY